MRLAALLILVSITNCSAAFTAEIKASTSKEGKTIVFLDGAIADGDSDSLKAIIRQSNDANRVVSGIRLNSPGGSLLEGAKLADIVRYGKISTVVPNGATCASACFIVFAAGTEKYASYGSEIGVHGASNKETGQESGDATVSMGRMAKDLGVPEKIIGKMVVTPAAEIVWLSPDDLRSMGTTITGKPAQVPPSRQTLPEALHQLNPSDDAAAQTQPQPTWANLVTGAFALSQQQNSGQPRVNRVCQPELKTCTTAVFFKGKDGNDVMVRTTEDPIGNALSHELCTLATTGSVPAGTAMQLAAT
jgi:hypothetical protein